MSILRDLYKVTEFISVLQNTRLTPKVVNQIMSIEGNLWYTYLNHDYSRSRFILILESMGLNEDNLNALLLILENHIRTHDWFGLEYQKANFNHFIWLSQIWVLQWLRGYIFNYLIFLCT